MKKLLAVFFVVTSLSGTVQAVVTVSNVRAEQIAGTDMVEIYYNLSAKGTYHKIKLEVFNEEVLVGSASATGDIGSGQTVGADKKISWDASLDWGAWKATTNMEFKIIATAEMPEGGDYRATEWEEINSRWLKNFYADGAITMTDKDNGNRIWVDGGDARGRSLDWEEAKSYCRELSYAGGGWKLPSSYCLKELDSQLNLFSGVFSSIHFGEYYWTSSHDYTTNLDKAYAGKLTDSSDTIFSIILLTRVYSASVWPYRNYIAGTYVGNSATKIIADVLVDTASKLTDYDKNGLYDIEEDFNGNGSPDAFEDFNGNGLPDAFEDFNSNGLPDAFEDFDGNYLADCLEGEFEDANSNGTPDFFETVHASKIQSSSHPDATQSYLNATFDAAWNVDSFSGCEGGWLWMVDSESSTAVSMLNGTYLSLGQDEVSVTNLSFGTHWFHLVPLDSSFNVISNAQATFKFNVDIQAPVVNSSTHPNSTYWHSNTNLAASWSSLFCDELVTGWRWLIDQSSNTVVAVDNSGLLDGETLSLESEGYEHGAWWLHLAPVDQSSDIVTNRQTSFLFNVCEASPIITSTTHPDQDVATGLNNVQLSWSITNVTVGSYNYFYAWDAVPSYQPTTNDTETSGRSAIFMGQADGSHYLHVMGVDHAGNKTPIAHYRVNINEITGEEAGSCPYEPDFTVSETSGYLPLTINFTDDSSGGATQWAWDFDSNGVVDSTNENASYTYRSEGSFSATLTVSGQLGTASETKTNLISTQFAPWDSDGDAIPNDWELQYFRNTTGADPAAAAANGKNTVMECYVAGLDPTDPEDLMNGIGVLENSAGGTQFVFKWNSISGRVYSVYQTTNLMSEFRCVESNIPSSRDSYTNSNLSEPGFYKVKVELDQ